MPESRRRTPVSIKRISVRKSYDLLADQLRETILSGDIPEGDTLPTERELVSQTGLSRGSVREALRLLAIEGLVRTRHGRLGGTFVMLPGNESMANAINQFVRGRRIPLRSLQETREILEPALARMAAERRTEQDIEEIKTHHLELVASVGNFSDFSAANVKWHNAVATASGNELLAAVIFSVSYGVEVATMTAEYDTMTTRQEVIRVHARVTAAIEAGDADLAERHMRAHIMATRARATDREHTDIPLSEEEE